MRLGRMRRLAVGTAIAVVLVPAGAGAASACDGAHNGVKAASFTLDHHARTHGVLAVASSYLGLSKAAIVSKLRAGESLGQIADSTSGKSAAGLVDALKAALAAKLAKAVSNGWITQAKADEILAKATPWLEHVVAAHFAHVSYGWRR